MRVSCEGQTFVNAALSTQTQHTHVQNFVVKEVVEVCLQAPWLS